MVVNLPTPWPDAYISTAANAGFTPTDVFPDIDIPVISIAWNYAGLSPQQMEDRIVSPFERFMTTVVDNIEHTESQTVGGAQ